MLGPVSSIFKIIILGQKGSGKNTLMDCVEQKSRFNNNLMTEFRPYRVNIFGTDHAIQVFNSWGDFPPHQNYFADTYGVILLFDVTYLESMYALRPMIEHLKQHIKTPISCFLVANKIDAITMKDDIRKEIERFRDTIKLPYTDGIYYHEISALNHTNIENLFVKFIAKFLNEDRCYNCYKRNIEVELIGGYLFCQECSKNPDLDKAKAFYRLQKD